MADGTIKLISIEELKEVLALSILEVGRLETVEELKEFTI